MSQIGVDIMTNEDYIRSKLSARDIAWMLRSWNLISQRNCPRLIDMAQKAHHKWAESASSNHGNMAKGQHGNTIIKENPSIWATEKWAYPDGTWRNSGRTDLVSLQVWLTMQYNPEEWEIKNE